MEPSLTRVRVLSVGMLIASLSLSPALASAAERGANAEQMMFWLLGLRMTQEPKKIDVNLATVDELRAVPGIQPQQALRIIAERPYAKLSDLVRAGIAPHLIHRLATFLMVKYDRPSVPNRR
jgi:radical SAM superfamily enzyme with C-terminal helix-hairpin-helix motif